MIYPMVPFPVTLSDPHGVIFKPIDALSVLCAQLTRDLLAIAKFLFYTKRDGNTLTGTPNGASNAKGL